MKSVDSVFENGVYKICWIYFGSSLGFCKDKQGKGFPLDHHLNLSFIEQNFWPKVTKPSMVHFLEILIYILIVIFYSYC